MPAGDVLLPSIFFFFFSANEWHTHTQNISKRRNTPGVEQKHFVRQLLTTHEREKKKAFTRNIRTALSKYTGPNYSNHFKMFRNIHWRPLEYVRKNRRQISVFFNV
jgi:hypothetical protein